MHFGVMERRIYIHAEILPVAAIKATDEVVPILEEIMEEAGRTLLKTVPIIAEVITAKSWASK
jgi:DNA polymerase I-like protein with 3'-5' exonuclease and polymerase domains